MLARNKEKIWCKLTYTKMVFIILHHEFSRTGIDLRVNRLIVFKNLSYCCHSSLLPLKYMCCPQIHSKILKTVASNKCSIVLPYSHWAGRDSHFRNMSFPLTNVECMLTPKMNNRHQQDVITLSGLWWESWTLPVAKRKDLLRLGLDHTFSFALLTFERPDMSMSQKMLSCCIEGTAFLAHHVSAGSLPSVTPIIPGHIVIVSLRSKVVPRSEKAQGESLDQSPWIFENQAKCLP